MKKYFKRNWFAFVIIALFIITIVLFVLPASVVDVKSLSYDIVKDSDHYQTAAGTQTFNFSVFDVLLGKESEIELLRTKMGETSPATAVTTIVWFYIPFNVWLGLGLLLLLVATILMAVDNRVVRIVGAVIALAGGALASLFLFFQDFDKSVGYPVMPYGATMDYDLTYQIGIWIALGMVCLTAFVCFVFCIVDNIKRYLFQKSEEERYLRGGI